MENGLSSAVYIGKSVTGCTRIVLGLKSFYLLKLNIEKYRQHDLTVGGKKKNKT